jgi:hypothetical protein
MSPLVPSPADSPSLVAALDVFSRKVFDKGLLLGYFKEVATRAAHLEAARLGTFSSIASIAVSL